MTGSYYTEGQIKHFVITAVNCAILKRKELEKKAIEDFIERVDRKVMLDNRFERCNCCGYDLNDQNNRDKLFSKTVLGELKKELEL